ncbi:ABC transporter substrate-binding protein [Actinopolymorpha pittospori]|uniref:Peptide/nickel transport system substrate-binding protein n=1 Tax=Actinopolymorpha pittospori TaxID=648752 RepID=A0A927RRC0_9ACTN|nr:ABC transporter substrate-binding protein [Actinopolymorpha pittospori]MBE1613173.1 peptide/nickel transport system substrate-binding protein [Actinopolymorpha pittospori]
MGQPSKVGRPRPRGVDRWKVVAGIAVLAMVALAACGGGGDRAASGTAHKGSGGTLRIAMSAGNIPFPATPPNEGYEGYRFVGNNIYDGLTRLNVEQAKEIATPHPALATSWRISPDKLTWTFTLREGVTFHDGTPFDADAVLFQFERVKNPGFELYADVDAPRYATYFRYFRTWKKIDDHTVALTTTQPYAWVLWDLAHIYFPSPTAVRKYGNDNYNAHASGTGPFRMTKYVDGEVMELSANEKYWRGRPKLDKIVLYPQPEAAARMSALQSAEVDWAEVPSPDALDQLKGDGFRIYLGKYPHGIMPRFNMFRPPFKGNLKLRQALNYALDREGTAALINNVGYPAKQYVYQGHPDYDSSFPGYTYDPAKAKRLLAEAGYRPGELKLTMGYTTGGSGNMFPEPMMQKLQADFKAVGVDVELKPMEWNTLITVGLEGLDKQQWSDIDILWASPAAGMTPNGYSTTFLCERPGGLPNAAGMCNPDVDRNYLAAASSFDQKQSQADLRAMMDAALKDADFLFWMHDLNLRVMSPKVHGYVQPKSWWVDFTKIWVEE